MKTIHYAGEILLTGDHIADAVVALAAALARRESSASIDIPVLFGGGDVRQASLLLGPASQLIVEPSNAVADEIVDESLVARLGRETLLLGTAKAQSESPPPGSDSFDDFDLA